MDPVVALYDSKESDKELSETSIDTYVTRMRTMLEWMEWTNPTNILKNPSKVLKRLKKAYGNETATLVNHVTAVLAAFRRNERLRCTFGEAFEKWKQAHQILKEAEKERYKQNEPTKTQAENYVSFNEIQGKLKDLQKDPNTFKDAKTHMQFLLLQVMDNLTPKRADLGNVRIVHKQNAEQLKELDEDGVNYIHIDSKTAQLVMNTFKTSKTYGQIVEDIPEKLRKVLAVSLKLFPRKHLFISPRSWEPYEKSNSYAQFVRRTFIDLFGKSAGVTLARHAFINERIDFNKMSIAERETIAQKMGHSMDMQTVYKWKNIP